MQVATTYENAMARKYPEQVSLAIAKDARGKHNPISLGWVMNTSIEPPMLAISIGLTRYSLEVLRHAREFVLSFVSSTMAEDALFHGTRSGRELDKLAQCGTKTQPATVIDSVLLADAVANFECKLESELVTGDHVIFVGRVVAAHMNEDPSVRRLYSLGNDQLGGVVPG
ncbi:MAG: flavin reductase family protein [Phycisphaerae bacterium]|nr:flavin reductase family protein [Phycisphaerae bacterium]